ncbi:histidinol phosphate phosphatase H [Punctularia strigosozonata HHB-11173 SS5]|uniref:Histidinol-phosphatase n=1 Tax=Punctularia strigosozonata (strain HHB-11173) TaxID=741275 RepID=R7S125_PUNST|nr:histidinol phosphate phosphatase H [Punctularia strigosozonata HHB-11173 SS5]EIN04080.1 histidinol phosphate phosphatase H [Punctularia strigosozonata HHB-11173 SS5]
MHSHHSHSGQFCAHAKGNLEDVVREAIAQGFVVYGLTEHVPRYRDVDLYPEERDLWISIDDLEERFRSFLHEAWRLKAQYASQITLLVGLETESISPIDLEQLDALLERHAGQIDYIVGSVHHVNEIPIDFDFATYERCLDSFTSAEVTSNHERLARYLLEYFKSQHTLLERFKPAVVGHFDLCRLYTPDVRISDFPDAYAQMEANIALAIGYGALFEVNAAAFRKGWEDAYPGTDVVEVILRHGGRFCLSDDSHGPHAVGLNYHRIPAYLARAGVTELWALQPAISSEGDVQPRSSVHAMQVTDWQSWPSWALNRPVTVTA